MEKTNRQRKNRSTEGEDEDKEDEQNKRRRLQQNALDDTCPSPLPNGSLGAGPGRVERFSANQLIGHGPKPHMEDPTGSIHSAPPHAQPPEEEAGMEEDEWEQACRLQAEFDESSWENMSNDPPAQTQSNPTFQAAKKFNGYRPGMEFKKGEEGFGYYPTRPPIISLATELAIPDMLHHPVKLELHKFFPSDDGLRSAMTAPNKKKVEKRRKQRERKRAGPLDSLQVAKVVKD